MKRKGTWGLRTRSSKRRFRLRTRATRFIRRRRPRLNRRRRGRGHRVRYSRGDTAVFRIVNQIGTLDGTGKFVLPLLFDLNIMRGQVSATGTTNDMATAYVNNWDRCKVQYVQWKFHLRQTDPYADPDTAVTKLYHDYDADGFAFMAPSSTTQQLMNNVSCKWKFVRPYDCPTFVLKPKFEMISSVNGGTTQTIATSMRPAGVNQWFNTQDMAFGSTAQLQSANVINTIWQGKQNEQVEYQITYKVKFYGKRQASLI